jgi:hypothetical protein
MNSITKRNKTFSTDDSKQIFKNCTSLIKFQSSMDTLLKKLVTDRTSKILHHSKQLNMSNTDLQNAPHNESTSYIP